MPIRRTALAAALLLLTAGTAVADDWAAAQLRGQVQQLLNDTWQPLKRGMVVSDATLVRTLASGHVVLTRGREKVELGPDTQIRIHDKGGAKPFTTVKQYFGTVSVEADVENVQHFAVDTPYLAAVVKGTRFTVTSGKTGASVSVRRGHVAVEDSRNKSHVTIAVGQSATIDKIETGNQIAVEGAGKLPVVLSAAGKPLPPIAPSPHGPVLTAPAGPAGPPAHGPGKPGKPDRPDKPGKGDAGPPTPPGGPAGPGPGPTPAPPGPGNH